MKRTGPMVTSRHEFARRSVPLRIRRQTALRRATSANAANPATPSAAACIPVVTQLAANAPTSAHQNHRYRAHRAAYICAARHDQTT